MPHRDWRAAPGVHALLASAALAGTLHAQGGGARDTTPARKAPPSADSLAAITRRGRDLARYDRVAWTATDSVMARGYRPTAEDRYVVRRMPDSTWEARFGRLTAAGDTFLVHHVVRQRATDPTQFTVEALATPRADTGFALRATRAIGEALRDFGTQPRPYNVAVLERPDGGLFVYLVPAQVQAGVFPLGGDVRYHVSADGRRILVKRQLHRAILERSVDPRGPNGLVAGTHTALLDDVPEDTDVFHVLVREPRVPEYVITSEFLYHIATDGRIELRGRTREILR